MTIILNHLGCPVGPAMSAEDFARWKRDLAELAGCTNVVCKCGGIAMPVNGALQTGHLHTADVTDVLLPSCLCCESRSDFVLVLLACFDACLYASKHHDGPGPCLLETLDVLLVIVAL